MNATSAAPVAPKIAASATSMPIRWRMPSDWLEVHFPRPEAARQLARRNATHDAERRLPRWSVTTEYNSLVTIPGWLYMVAAMLAAITFLVLIVFYWQRR